MAITGKLAAAVAAAFVCGAGAAQAEGLIDEVRFGVFDHDTAIVGSSKEEGADINVELLSQPISSLRIIGQPRLAVGAMLNTAGQTNQVYVGLDAQWPFAHDAIRSGDSFFLEGDVGVAWHDGKIDVRGTPEEAEWKSHGSDLLFRTGFGLGYRFDETWSVALTLHHISNANLEHPNEGSNNIGIQTGFRF